MRLIDADELRKQWSADDACDHDYTHLHFLASIDSAPTIDKWIPVTERLPERNGRYLVTRGLNACGDLWNRTYIINYSDLMGIKSHRIWWDGNVGKSDFKRFDDVIAWMPLPKPYEGSEEDEDD